MKTNTQNTAQYTPGPWRIECDGSAIIGADGGTLVVETTRAFWANLAAASAQGSTLAEKHLPEVEANARLISAAPELLEALKELAFAVETIAHLQGLERDLLPMADKARSAIAKAMGGVK